MTTEPARFICPLCGSATSEKILEARDYTVSGETFAIRECHQCTVRFTCPVPDEQHISRYYDSENYISHSDTSKGLVNKLYHVVRKVTLNQKKRYIEKYTGAGSGHILDIGCGTGAFLNLMKQSGWEITGTEPDEGARQTAFQKYGITALPSSDLFHLPAKQYHAISLWHVLEHIHSLHEYLNQMNRLLHPQGTIFIAVPNYTSLDAENYQSYWAAYDVPRHLYHFSPKSMEILADKHALEIRAQLSMPFDAFYISLLSEKYRYGHNHYFSAFGNGLRSWIYGKRYPRKSSSVLYILKSKAVSA